MCSLSVQVEQINSVFTAAGKQKAWDHFTKAQRKNLVLWSKHCQVGGLSRHFCSVSCHVIVPLPRSEHGRTIHAFSLGFNPNARGIWGTVVPSCS